MVAFLLRGGMAHPKPEAGSESPVHRTLAEHHAPAIYQETRSGFLDFITRFDFDGDWNGSNNWINAYLYDLPAHVYYAVIETENHYFITYAFFHPRDYSAQPVEGFAPKMEHENDMEGCTLLVEKDGTETGRLVLLETLAHDKFFKYAGRSGDVSPNWASLDGVIQTETGPDGKLRPIVFVEPEGHGVYGLPLHGGASMEDFPGVIYRFTPRGAEVPVNPNDPDVSFDLIAVEPTLWERRFQVAGEGTYCCADDFAVPDGARVLMGDSFNGPMGGCAARPPWGWDEKDDGPIEKGDWFRDPVKTFSHHFNIVGLDSPYSHNPYLDSRDAAEGPIPRCSPATASRTVRESIFETAIGMVGEIFSGGFGKETVRRRAGQLFLTQTALLEWSAHQGLREWSWAEANGTEPVPRFALEEGFDLLRVPITPQRSLSSPALNAPARYFNRLILKYRSRLEDIGARLHWRLDNLEDAETEFSLQVRLPRSEAWRVEAISLSEAAGWDPERNVVRLFLELEGSEPSTSNVTPSWEEQSLERQGELEVQYVILDRLAFTETFVQ